MYNDLNSKQQFTLLTELLPFVLPKQSSLTADLNFDKMTDADIEDVFARLYTQVNSRLLLDNIPEAIPEFEIIPDAPKVEKTKINYTNESIEL
jgi:hypothetical protein